MSSYLERYLAGEYEQVWDDLVALGPAVREQPIYTDALAVAHETMRRVRHNIELIIPRLRELGYLFGHSWALERGVLTGAEAAEMDRDDPPHDPPTGNVVELMEELERRAGVLPLSLQAFYQVVGGVNFIGSLPAWEIEYLCDLDPLQVLSAHSVLRLDDWNHWSDERQEDGICELPIAPDAYGKYFYSGGGPYAIPLRGPAADVLLRYARRWPDSTFVIYLRVSLQWAGLPGMESPKQPAGLTESLESLSADLLPF